AADAAGTAGPLAGYRVLELGSTIAGPFCGRLFADFGAEVVKIEAPEGDPLRTMGSHVGDVSLYAASLLRNKSLLALDLRQPEGRQIALRLAAACDVVIENFRPGTLERWGLGYEQLREVNRGIVMVRISGFGQNGPYSGRPGYGVIGEALSGLRGLTGDPDRPPARINTSLGDYLTGLYAAFGAVMALNLRGRTGEGQVVDAALYECAFSLLEPHVPAFEKLGLIAQRAGSALPGSVPNNLYRCADGRHIHITAMADPVFRRLCAAMERAGLADDPRFAKASLRVANAAAIDAAIEQWTGSRPLAEIEAALLRHEVPASRIYDVADIFADPHYAAREMLPSVPSDELGSVTLTQVVPRLAATPGRIRHAGGAVGRDTRPVLARLLAMTEAEIEALVARQIVACA
ncbi:MAG: CaiB/BaiF CoA transferase family protein, partial [Burkholderiaceae bacterium]